MGRIIHEDLRLKCLKKRIIVYATVVLVTLLTFKFQQIVRSWYSIQVTFVCTALWAIYLRSNLPNLFQIRRDLRKLWQNTFWCFFMPHSVLSSSTHFPPPGWKMSYWSSENGRHCCWEANCRSDVALVMCHIGSGISTLTRWLKEER